MGAQPVYNVKHNKLINIRGAGWGGPEFGIQ